jgi:hypothetical protein
MERVINSLAGIINQTPERIANSDRKPPASNLPPPMVAEGHFRRGKRMEKRKMRRSLVAGLGFLAIAGLASTAHAQRFEFDYTGSLAKFTVPIDGTYQIIAFGAQGGNTTPLYGAVGGRGAEIGGDFSLTAGKILQIAVGAAGSAGVGGGGGGGSFVVGPGNTPLVIAGGGGGAGPGVYHQINPPEPDGGGDGLTGPDGSGGGFSGGNGGTGGNGGGASLAGGGGGGGFFSAGASSINAKGGGAFPDLTGGNGGGGGPSLAGGGGGGYSGGGGGGGGAGGLAGGGGGGGSFDAGTDRILVAGIWTGNGKVVVNLVSPVFAGTPGKANCHGQSVSALAKQFGGLDNAAEALNYPNVDALQNVILAYCGD